MLDRFADAVELYRESIEVHPTAEAQTYLGWSLSHLGRLEEAVAEAKKAIPLDPDFGNPYNDIGVYLTELGRLEEAVPWLERATKAKRYCCYQFPHFNLGRIQLRFGRIEDARRSFERALSYDPAYPPARKGLELVKQQGQTL